MEDRQNYSKKDSIIETMSSVTVSILTSASILAVGGMLLGIISTHGVISQMGQLLAIGAALSTTIVLFVIPGMLYLLDGVIEKTTAKANFYKESKPRTYESFTKKVSQN